MVATVATSEGIMSTDRQAVYAAWVGWRAERRAAAAGGDLDGWLAQHPEPPRPERLSTPEVAEVLGYTGPSARQSTAKTLRVLGVEPVGRQVRTGSYEYETDVVVAAVDGRPGPGNHTRGDGRRGYRGGRKPKR